MKDFEVIDFDEYQAVIKTKVGWVAEHKALNKLINEKYQKGYTIECTMRINHMEDISNPISSIKQDDHTHEALVILREIEKKNPVATLKAGEDLEEGDCLVVDVKTGEYRKQLANDLYTHATWHHGKLYQAPGCPLDIKPECDHRITVDLSFKESWEEIRKFVTHCPKCGKDLNND